MKKWWCCALAAITLLAGTATATACGGKSGGETSSKTSSVNMSDVTLKFVKRTYDIEDGQSVALQVEFTVNDEAMDTSELTFTSNDPTVATVSADGTVTGVSGGTTRIKVSYGTKFSHATVNVTMREKRIELSESNLLLLQGAERQVTATAYYGLTELTDAVLSWQSSDASVATVENGLITAVGVGKANITVSTDGVTVTIAVTSVVETTAENVNTFSEEYINIYGRSYIEDGELNLDNAANGVEIGFIGTSLQMNMYSQANGYMRVYVDGEAEGRRKSVATGRKDYTVVSGLEDGLHVVRIVKCTEEQQNAYWHITSFSADKFFAMPKKPELKIEFIGDSITAGHGAIGTSAEGHTIDTSDATKTYAYLAAQALGADYSVVAFSGICTEAYHWCKGYNLNMAKLYNQMSYKNQQSYTFDFDADVVVLNLGTNEASYLTTTEGGGYGEQFPTDYLEFLETIRAKQPDAYIICLYGMMDKMPAIDQGIKEAIAEFGDDKIVYNPFAITGNGDGGNGHPDAEAHQEWSEDLVAYIQTLNIKE